MQDLSKYSKLDTFGVQNQIVISSLVENHGFTIEQAFNTWFRSKTRHEIQDVLGYDWVAPTRCLSELRMEISNDSYWMMDDFES